MALIKCSECGKEISDKAKVCVHCGCPIEEILVCQECGEKVSKDDEICKNCGCPLNSKEDGIITEGLGSKIWLLISIIACFGISTINFLGIFNVEPFSVIVSGLHVNIMGVLSLLLGIVYIFLLKSFSKKSFYLLLATNIVVAIYNIMFFNTIIHLYYIVCVIINVLVTFFAVRKKLVNNKFSIKEYIIMFMLFAIGIGLIIYFVFPKSDNPEIDRSNERNPNTIQIQVVTEYINIRERADITSSILGKVEIGDIYDVISECDGGTYHWYEIETSDGIRGYIAGSYYDETYVIKLDEEKNNSSSVEIPEEKETNNNTTNNSNTNSNKSNNTKSNTNNTSKKCDEKAKQQLTNEYQTTLNERTVKHNEDMQKAKQELNLLEQTMESVGYISKEEYEQQYSQATSDTYRKLLNARYGASQNYDSYVKTYNQLEPTFQKWKDTYADWYKDELKKLGC